MRKLTAQRWLTGCWCLLALLATGLLLLYTTGRPQADSASLWQWYCPYVFPTLLLLLGTLVTAELREEKVTSSRFLFWLCLGLSALYGACLLFVLLVGIRQEDEGAQTLSPDLPTLLVFLKSSSIWLTVVQSVVTTALGGFSVADTANKKVQRRK